MVLLNKTGVVGEVSVRNKAGADVTIAEIYKTKSGHAIICLDAADNPNLCIEGFTLGPEKLGETSSD